MRQTGSPRSVITNMQGRRHGFVGGDTISRAKRAKKIGPLPFANLGDTKQNIARFIIVIMTSKRLPVPNEIT